MYIIILLGGPFLGKNQNQGGFLIIELFNVPSIFFSACNVSSIVIFFS